MAMYYYASKLNEASCSGCQIGVPPPPQEPPPTPPQPIDHPPVPSDAALLHGSGLSYYDNDDYYSMVRSTKYTAESSYKQVVMNGGLNYGATQNKIEERQVQVPLMLNKPLPPPPITDLAARHDIEYRDGQIVSATLDALIDTLRPGGTRAFAFTFFLCSRLFIKPHELLTKLCKRYLKNYDKINKNGENPSLVEKELADMATLVHILRYWTNTIPYDFRDERVMALLRSITQRSAADHLSPIRNEVSSMLQRLLEKLTSLERYEATLKSLPQVSTADHLPQGDIILLGLSPTDLANQLTVIELHKLAYIGPEEFVQAFVPSSQSCQPTTSYDTDINLHHIETKCTKNLEAYADWFNRLTYVVATDILKPPKAKYRARIIEQWVMTARECFNLGNFNSMMAIVGAMGMFPIGRLKKTWSRTTAVCAQQLKQLELCLEPGGNHARYRAALAAAPRETAIPLFSVTCRDLHFIHQVKPTKLSPNRINFEKCLMMSRAVCAQLAARRLTNEDVEAMPPPPPHPPAWRFLHDKATLRENALELLSFEREPPSDHSEKDRMKRLRVVK